MELHAELADLFEDALSVRELGMLGLFVGVSLGATAAAASAAAASAAAALGAMLVLLAVWAFGLAFIAFIAGSPDISTHLTSNGDIGERFEIEIWMAFSVYALVEILSCI